LQDHLGLASIGNTMKYVSIASKRRDEFAERLDGWPRFCRKPSFPELKQYKYSVEFRSHLLSIG
jgi:hypothetical protein